MPTLRARAASALLPLTMALGQTPPTPSAAPAAAELRRLEAQLRASAGASERVQAAQAYRTARVRTADLAGSFPLNALEQELVKVIGIEKSMRAGAYRHAVGHHVVLLAPAPWLERLGPALAETVATLDTAVVLLEDLTGCDLARARGRRLLIVFTPDHPKTTAQTLEAVVWVGMGYLTVPPTTQVLFHELGHELFPPWNLRPRADTFNEMWPELGRQYVTWCLGQRDEFEASRARFLTAYQDEFLRHGVPLEHLGPYDIGAGMLQSVVDAALRRDDGYDWEPLRRFFRSVLAVPETDSFFQKQETLAFLLTEALGPRAQAPLQQAGFVLRKERQQLLPAEIASAAPLLLAVRKALDQDDAPAATKAVARLDREFPGSPWTAAAHTALAGRLMARTRTGEALTELQRAGHIPRWQVLGPFANAGGAGMRTGYPPEARIDLQAGCEHDGQRLRWQAATPAANGYVDLDARFTPNDAIVAYAYVELSSDRDRAAALWTSSDDTLAAWVNGREVVRRELPRGCFVDNERTPITLRAGRNALLLKLGDFSGGFGFTCRVTDDHDVPLPVPAAPAGR